MNPLDNLIIECLSRIEPATTTEMCAECLRNATNIKSAIDKEIIKRRLLKMTKDGLVTNEKIESKAGGCVKFAYLWRLTDAGKGCFRDD